jgi:hypothetical protein
MAAAVQQTAAANAVAPAAAAATAAAARTGLYEVSQPFNQRRAQGSMQTAVQQRAAANAAAPTAAAAAATAVAAGTALDEGTQAFIHHRAQQSQELTLQVEENILASQGRQIRQFARRHHSTQPSTAMPPGSFVMMKSPQSTKMHKSKSIEGPYRLVRYTGPDQTQAILEDADKKRWPVHCTRITPYSVNQNI